MTCLFFIDSLNRAIEIKTPNNFYNNDVYIDYAIDFHFPNVWSLTVLIT